MNSIEEITTYSSKQQISQKPKKQETAAHLAPRLWFKAGNGFIEVRLRKTVGEGFHSG
jgi:hypothetical protein